MTLGRKNYILLAVFLGFFLLLGFFAVWPLLKSIEKNAAEIKKEQESLDLLGAKTQILGNFKNKYQASQDAQKIKDFFIDPEAPISFITFLEKMAKEENVSLDISLLPPSKKEKEGISPGLRFLLRGEGLFLSFYNFLARLERAPYLIEIESLTLQKQQEQEQKEMPSDILDFSLSLKVYASRWSDADLLPACRQVRIYADLFRRSASDPRKIKDPRLISDSTWKR